MPKAAHTDEQLIAEIKRRGVDFRPTAFSKEMRVDYRRVKALLATLKQQPITESLPIPAMPIAEPETGIDYEFSELPSEKTEVKDEGDTKTVTFSNLQCVDTPAELLARAGINLEEWKILRQTVKGYQVAIVPRVTGSTWDGWSRESTEPMRVQMYAVSISLEPRVEAQSLVALTQTLIERMENHAPKYPRFGYAKSPNPHMAVFSIPDLHLGGLAWEKETGQQWDMEIAQNAFLEALDLMLERTASFKLEKILLPIGNDLIHVDSNKGETFKGTRQDMAARYRQIMEAAQALLIQGIDRISSLAPVEVRVISGNHAPESEFMLGRVLGAWYRNCQNVEVVQNFAERQYVEYGATLIGYTHGHNKQKPESLVMNMTSEAREAWARCKFFEWHLGHLHHKREYEINGVLLRYLSSLTATNSWHSSAGYVGQIRQAEAFLYHPDNGLAGYFPVKPKAIV